MGQIAEHELPVKERPALQHMGKTHIAGISTVSGIDFPVSPPLPGNIAEPLKAAGRNADDLRKIELSVHEGIKDSGCKDAPHGAPFEYEDGRPVGIFIFSNQMHHILL